MLAVTFQIYWNVSSSKTGRGFVLNPSSALICADHLYAHVLAGDGVGQMWVRSMGQDLLWG